MCARYELDPKNKEVARILKETAEWTAAKLSNNTIYPTNTVPVLVAESGRLKALPMVWGFPGFIDHNKPDNKPKPLINTKIETAATLKTWHDSFDHRRCIIPTTGFYEWNKSKVKHIFTIPGSELLYIAGIYKTFEHDGAQVKEHFSMLTTAANESVMNVHERMPFVLMPAEYDTWLTGDYRSFAKRENVVLLKEVA